MKGISLKALAVGVTSIIAMGLTLQLIFLLLATAYTSLLKHYPEISSFGTMISYSLGIIAYFIIMSLGGYITAHLAKNNITLHCLLVSGVVVGISLITSVRSDNFTYLSILFALSGLVFTVIGGRVWLKHSITDAE